MADSYVQVAPDSSGKQIDAAAITAASGSTVYRQTIVIGDPSNIGQVVDLDQEGQLTARDPIMRVQAYAAMRQAELSYLQAGMGAGFMPLELPSFIAGL
jgi:hypothetical protein